MNRVKEKVQVTPDFSYNKHQRFKPSFPVLTVWMLPHIKNTVNSSESCIVIAGIGSELSSRTIYISIPEQ